MSLQASLLSWFNHHRRDLPWRGEPDPYRILLSEVLLQQTRVDQATPYYHRLLQRFPTLRDLALASQEEVLMVWQGAGYYGRARNLHKLAVQVCSHGAGLPSTYAELLKLPGLGPYTAAAVASMAFAEPVAVVDGNVRRVVSRLKAWENPIPTEVQRTAQELLSLPHPGEWNQALMELGSLVCTPQNPRCAECPIRRWCKGKANPSQYPTPKVRKPKALEVVALVLVGPEGVHLEARRGRILGGLWGVPMQENPGGLERLLAQFGLSRAESCGTIQHAFTHRKLSVQVYRADWNGQEQPGQRPLSRLDQKVLGCAGVFL